MHTLCSLHAYRSAHRPIDEGDEAENTHNAPLNTLIVLHPLAAAYLLLSFLLNAHRHIDHVPRLCHKWSERGDE